MHWNFFCEKFNYKITVIVYSSNSGYHYAHSIKPTHTFILCPLPPSYTYRTFCCKFLMYIQFLRDGGLVLEVMAAISH